MSPKYNGYFAIFKDSKNMFDVFCINPNNPDGRVSGKVFRSFESLTEYFVGLGVPNELLPKENLSKQNIPF